MTHLAMIWSDRPPVPVAPTTLDRFLRFPCNRFRVQLFAGPNVLFFLFCLQLSLTTRYRKIDLRRDCWQLSRWWIPLRQKNYPTQIEPIGASHQTRGSWNVRLRRLLCRCFVKKAKQIVFCHAHFFFYFFFFLHWSFDVANHQICLFQKFVEAWMWFGDHSLLNGHHISHEKQFDVFVPPVVDCFVYWWRSQSLAREKTPIERPIDDIFILFAEFSGG